MPSRRAVLAATLATAGCLRSPGGTDSPDAQPRRSPDAPDGTDTCTGGYLVSADPFDPAEELPVELGDARRSLVGTAVDDGATEVTTYAAGPPVRDGVLVEHDGAFYRTAATETDATEVAARPTDVEWERGVTPPADATVVAYDDLPATDRRALEYAIYGPEYGREKSGHPTEGLAVRDNPVPYPDGATDSRLAGAGETWVRWNERAYRVRVDDEATTTTRYTYRVALARVADGAAGFREHVAGEYLVRLADLPADERAVVEAAVADGHEECEPASAALRGLLDRLPEDGTLPHPRDGSWYVAYDGDRYEFDVTNWVR